MLYVSNRNIVIRSSKIGQSISFEKGKPTYVPRQMVAEVMEKGILPVDDDGKTASVDSVETEQEKKVVLAPEDADEREDKIKAVVEAIVKRNSSKDFTAGGIPSAAAVSAALGWRTDQKEVRKVWDANKGALLNQKAA